VIVEIDHQSGFCFGVNRAIGIAERALKTEKQLYALGHIIHNELELNRLKELGLQTITHEEFFSLNDCSVLIRTHGEPPPVYEYAAQNNIKLIEGTCPVVLKLQHRVKTDAERMLELNGQIVIFGHQNHAEIIGLVGQTRGTTIIAENPNDFEKIDRERPVAIYAQTTKPVGEFKSLVNNIKAYSNSEIIESHDTICRQVSGRIPHLASFAARYDIVVFVGGSNSSNAKVLFEVCKKANEQSYFVVNSDEMRKEWFINASRVGVCGATSTPFWLMEQIAANIRNI